ncbi:MAG: altronate dehydratase family protein [Candidatus Spyradocola sp.]|nr:altronate dehydratase family protein [Candidatus Spyradocola sp.]
MKEQIVIHEKDNVAVRLTPLGDIPAGHKVALCDIPAGGAVIKYGHPIGRATRPIRAGEWVHTHNLSTALRSDGAYEYHPIQCELPPREPAQFLGFVRPDGRVGVRNEVWILPTVGCVGRVAERLAQQARGLLHGSATNVLAFPHPYGCSQLGGDQENTRRALAALACHPNAGGVLVLGLGCENSGVEEIRSRMAHVDENRVKFLVCQDVEDEMAAGLSLLKELIDAAAEDERVPMGADKLIVGLKCGGSDGFSGLTANPVIGAFSDLLVSMGGTTILTEVPEMFGAEDLLLNRCRDEATFHQAVDMIQGFKDYFTAAGQPVYENPSPGNREGGITTLEDKALGCTQKSGSAPVVGVLDYAQPAQSHGLHLLSAPGNDLVATTALALSGAQLVLFSTGRGTPFAGPVPTLKLSTNPALSAHKSRWIDFDAAPVLQGEPIPRAAERLLTDVLRIANGAPVRSEEAGLQDMAIFKTGVTL